MGVRGRSLTALRPPGINSGGAFVGADPPGEVPVHHSGDVWMDAGTLPSSGYLRSSFMLQGHPNGNWVMR